MINHAILGGTLQDFNSNLCNSVSVKYTSLLAPNELLSHDGFMHTLGKDTWLFCMLACRSPMVYKAIRYEELKY